MVIVHEEIVDIEDLLQGTNAQAIASLLDELHYLTSWIKTHSDRAGKALFSILKMRRARRSWTKVPAVCSPSHHVMGVEDSCWSFSIHMSKRMTVSPEPIEV
jgi:hypothetical protein